MALLKDLIVTGASKFIGDAYFNKIKSGTWQGNVIAAKYGGLGIDASGGLSSSATKPIYINSSGVATVCNAYPTKSSWNYDDTYTKSAALFASTASNSTSAPAYSSESADPYIDLTYNLNGSNTNGGGILIKGSGITTVKRTAANVITISSAHGLSTKSFSVNNTGYNIYTSSSSLPTIYAPTEGGDSGSILISKGSTTTPEWLKPGTKNKTYYLKAVTSNADSFTVTTSWTEVPTIATGDAAGQVKFNGTNATVNGWSTVSSNASNGLLAYEALQLANADVQGTVDRWDEVVHFLSTITESDTVASILQNYVTLDSAQTIKGSKTFSNPISGDLLGNATTADRVKNSLTVQLNGGTTVDTNKFIYDGSAAKTINITPSSIGAAASSHGTHVTTSTCVTAFGTKTGAITLSTATTLGAVSFSMSDNQLTGTATLHSVVTTSADGIVPTISVESSKITSSVGRAVLCYDSTNGLKWRNLPDNAFNYAANTDRYVNSAKFEADTTNNNVLMTLTRAGSDSATVTANIPVFGGASSSAAGTSGLVKVPTKGQQEYYLRGDCTWQSISTTDANVTQTATDSTNATYEVLFSSTADNTTRTEGARKTQYLTYNPSTKLLTLSALTASGAVNLNGTTSIDSATIGNLTVTGASTLTGNVSMGTVTSGVWNGTAIANSYITSALTGKTYNGYTLADACAKGVYDKSSSWNPLDTTTNTLSTNLLTEQALKYALDGISVYSVTTGLTNTTFELNSSAWTDSGITISGLDDGVYALYIKDTILNTTYAGMFSNYKITSGTTSHKSGADTAYTDSDTTGGNASVSAGENVTVQSTPEAESYADLEEIPLHMNSYGSSKVRIYAATWHGKIMVSSQDSSIQGHTLTIKYKRII